MRVIYVLLKSYCINLNTLTPFVHPNFHFRLNENLISSFFVIVCYILIGVSLIDTNLLKGLTSIPVVKQTVTK